VVLERDHLPVERERPEAWLTLEEVEERPDHRDEARAEALESLVPLAIPVRVRDDEDAPRQHPPEPRHDVRRREAAEDADDHATEHVERVVDADDHARQRDRAREEQPEGAEPWQHLAERDRGAECERSIARGEREGGRRIDERGRGGHERQVRTGPAHDLLQRFRRYPRESEADEDGERHPRSATARATIAHERATEEPPHQTLKVRERDDDGDDPDELRARCEDREIEALVEPKELIHQRARMWRQTNSAIPPRMTAATM